MAKEIKCKDGFTQVCIWPATELGDKTAEDFERRIKEELDVEVQFLEVLYTKPDMKDGIFVPETGGRSDLFFAIKTEDIEKFAIVRLTYGISWIEDFIANGGAKIHDEHIKKYLSW